MISKTIAKSKGNSWDITNNYQVAILDFLDENHCKNSIDLTKGDWYFEPE